MKHPHAPEGLARPTWVGWALVLMLAAPAALALPKCLFVSSYHQGYAWSDGVELGLRRTLEDKCVLRQFDMDTKRHKEIDQIEAAAQEAKQLIETWPKIDLFVPLMIDYEYWFANSMDNPLGEQIETVFETVEVERLLAVHPAVSRLDAAFVGEHDFASFCRRPRVGADRPAPSLVRIVHRAEWHRVDDGPLLRFEIAASSFCHQMVRSIVGTLVDGSLQRLLHAAAVAHVQPHAHLEPLALRLLVGRQHLVCDLAFVDVLVRWVQAHAHRSRLAHGAQPHHVDAQPDGCAPSGRHRGTVPQSRHKPPGVRR